MKYFFVLGTNQALSIAELTAIFPNEIKNAELLSKEILIVDIEKLNPSELIKKIGGTIKIGIINKEINFGDIVEESITLIDGLEKEGKFKYGISFYGKNNFRTLKTGLEIKKHLKKQNISCRFVTSKEKTLSSVVVEQNKLISKGAEIILIENGNKILLGQTMAVQPFKELSFRDYGRPARDDHSGMLPPKLAQIMINLASDHQNNHKDIVLLDPFCGSGTVLTEAIAMGYENLIGSDLSKKAIEDTEKNINWILRKFESSSTNYELHNISATEIDKKIKPNSVNAIATEPYLGPQRGKHNIKNTIKELENLYSLSLQKFAKIIKEDGAIAMIWPIFASHSTKVTRDKKATMGKPIHTYINPRINNFKIINPIPNNLNNELLTQRNTIVYGRPGQKVWREIVILKKR